MYILNIHYTLFNLDFKVAKDKLVSSSYKNDFKTTKARNYNLLKFKILKRVILKNVALKLEKNEKQIQLELKKKKQHKFNFQNHWMNDLQVLSLYYLHLFPPLAAVSLLG